MSTFVLIIFIILQSVVIRASEKNGVFEKIKSGLQYAKNYLDTAKEIADLVSKSLGHRNNVEKQKNRNDEKRGDDGGADKVPKVSGTPNFVSGFFRLLGLDSSRIAAIAVNSVLFLAQMISSMFDVKPKIEESRARNDEEPFDPLEFIVGNKNERITFCKRSTRNDEELFDPVEFIVGNKNERIQNLLQQAQDPALPGHLINRLDGLNSACVRLLMCKSSPIILAAQNSLRNRTNERRFDITSWLPRMEDFEVNADSCEDKHSDCILFPEST